jgi:hypothetical protein
MQICYFSPDLIIAGGDCRSCGGDGGWYEDTDRGRKWVRSKVLARWSIDSLKVFIFPNNYFL